MLDRASLQQSIVLIFEQKLNVIVPSPTEDLFASGSLDSLLFAELLSQLEVEYGIRVHLEELDLENFQSIDSIAEFVAQRLGRQGTPPGLFNYAGGS
jgi:methoxymalonate biosynthesis acyl carrier protein